MIPADLDSDALLERLRTLAEAPSRDRARRLWPVLEPIAELLPDPGLKAGAAYRLDGSGSLLAALLVGASQDGQWCGLVGIDDFGVESAQALGVRLERLVLIPDPGPDWLKVAAALVEAVPVVAVRPLDVVRAGDATRLASRMREHNAVLLVQGEWPHCEAGLRLDSPDWVGLGPGHGHLQQRQVTLTVSSNRFGAPRQARLVLPTPTGRLAPAHPDATLTPLRAVG